MPLLNKLCYPWLVLQCVYLLEEQQYYYKFNKDTFKIDIRERKLD